MTATVAVPVWLLVAISLLALWAVLYRLLIPSVRWYLRRRVNRVIDEVNARLRIRLQPFKLTKRQVLIDRLVYDAKVIEAVEARASASGAPRDALIATVHQYAREIVPAFNAYLYFRAGYWLGRRLAQALFRVRVGVLDEQAVARVPAEATVVFIINHRSNMDYVLVAYLAAERAAVSYAVGEWARIWPLQTLIRAMGAFFVRRNSGDPLYRRVLERYIAMAVEAGVTQAVFPEGGLSRDGRLRPPRMGLIDYMLRGFDPDGPRDLVFVPVGINYDRTLEDRTLTMRRDPDAPPVGKWRATETVLRFLARNLGQMLAGRWYRFGYAGVNFGRPLSLKAYLAERGFDFRALPETERRARVEELAAHLMAAVGSVIPVLPVALVATVLLRRGDEGVDELDLKAAVKALIERLEGAGARVHVPRRDRDYAVWVGLRMLRLRHLVLEEQGLYRASPADRPLLEYYANAIAHLLPDEAAT